MAIPQLRVEGLHQLDTHLDLLQRGFEEQAFQQLNEMLAEVMILAKKDPELLQSEVFSLKRPEEGVGIHRMLFENADQRLEEGLHAARVHEGPRRRQGQRRARYLCLGGTRDRIGHGFFARWP